MIVKARIVALLELLAVAERIKFVQSVYERVQRGDVRKWAKVKRAVLNHLPGLEDARKLFVGHAQDRVGLSVL